MPVLLNASVIICDVFMKCKHFFKNIFSLSADLSTKNRKQEDQVKNKGRQLP